MTYTNTALLPVSPDEAFALITEPERLRRWQTVSAYVDLRADGDYRWTVTPGHVAAGTQVDVGRDCRPAPQPFGIGDQGEGLVGRDGEQRGVGVGHDFLLGV